MRGEWQRLSCLRRAVVAVSAGMEIMAFVVVFLCATLEVWLSGLGRNLPLADLLMVVCPLRYCATGPHGHHFRNLTLRALRAKY